MVQSEQLSFSVFECLSTQLGSLLVYLKYILHILFQLGLKCHVLLFGEKKYYNLLIGLVDFSYEVPYSSAGNYTYSLFTKSYLRL